MVMLTAISPQHTFQALKPSTRAAQVELVAVILQAIAEGIGVEDIADGVVVER